MSLSAPELAIWTRLTDDAPPTELPHQGSGVQMIRWFEAAPGDNRWPAMIAVPRLLSSVPHRVVRLWVGTLLAEVSGRCVYCHRTRGELPSLVHRSCPLSGAGRAFRGWMLPGAINALAETTPAPPRPSLTRPH